MIGGTYGERSQIFSGFFQKVPLDTTIISGYVYERSIPLTTSRRFRNKQFVNTAGGKYYEMRRYCR